MTKLTKEEKDKSTNILKEIEEFVKHVPVAKYTAPCEENNFVSSLEFQKKDGVDCFFQLDYSDELTRNGRSGYQLLRLIREFSILAQKFSSHDFWKIFGTELPKKQEGKIKEYKDAIITYKDTIITCMTYPEDVAKMVTSLLLTREFKGKFIFDIFQQYLYKKFRETPDKENYFVPQDSFSQNFYQSIRIFRNKGQHLDGDVVSGEKNKLFAPPAGSADPEIQLKYYRERHLSIALYMLFVFDRFFDELWEILEMEEEPFDDSEERRLNLLEKSKKIINSNYIRKQHEAAAQAMHQLFLGTGIQNHPQLLYGLPEPYVKTDSFSREVEIGGGSDILSDATEPFRRLIIGDVGTGKTVMFLRMIQRDQPRLTPFYLSFDRIEIGDPVKFLRYLEHQVLGLDYLTLEVDELEAVRSRLHHQLADGKAVFFFDSLEACPSQVENLIRWIKEYPQCWYMVASQPDSKGNGYLDVLKENSFKTYEVLPLKNDQVQQIMRFTSLSVSRIDHTKLLTKYIKEATQGTDMIRHPFSLMQLIELFEDNQEKDVLANNQSRLCQSLIDRIQNNNRLTSEECEKLLAQPFLVRYKEAAQQVRLLFEEVLKSFNNPQQGNWREIIVKSPLVMEGTLASLRTLFELMELIPTKNQNEKHDLMRFQTLVTSELLKRDLRRCSKNDMTIGIDLDGQIDICKTNLPAITPMLSLLAEATVNLCCIRPSADAYEKKEGSCGRVFFGLYPRYIVEQYLLTVLHVYRMAGVTVDCYKKELKELFGGIARSGSQELYEELFNPYWMRQWLIHEKDVIPGTQYGGMVADNNKALLSILQRYCIRHNLLLPLMMKQYIWIRMWKLDNTMQLWEGMMRYAIIYNMSDGLREDLYNRLKMMDNSQNHQTVGYYMNLVISTMESLSLVDQYDTGIEDIPGLVVQYQLMNMQNRRDALKLLIKWLYQIYRRDDSRNKKRLFVICEHLINYNATSTQQVSEEFWDFLTILSENTSYRKQLSNLLDKIPIEDIPYSIALRLYDESIYEYVLRVRKKERKIENAYNSFPSVFQRSQQMFRPVTKVYEGLRDNIQYTFYSQPDCWTFEVATECISEMPEGKFCLIRKNKFEQWFYVEDVVLQETERPLYNGIAEVSLVIPHGAPRPRIGKFKIVGISEDAVIPYIHLFERDGCHEVVVRIEEQHWVGVLAMPETQEILRNERHIVWNGYDALLTGIDVRIPPKEMCIVRLKAVTPFLGVGSPKSIELMELDNIPHQGLLTFYNTKDKLAKYNKLSLSLIWRGNIAEATKLDDVLYIGCWNGKHFLATYKQVNVGNTLHWGNFFVNVDAVYVTGKEATEEQKAPVSIYTAYTQYMGRLFKALKEDKGKKIVGTKRRYVYPYIIETRSIMPIDRVDIAKQTVIDESVDVMFYHPIVDPMLKSWEPKNLVINLNKVAARKVKVDDRNMIAMQDGAYPKEIAYYYDPYDHCRRPVKWYESLLSQEQSRPHRRLMLLDDELKASWNKAATISFYSSADNKDEKPIEVHFDNLSNLVDIHSFVKYHASVTPLLLKEWITQNSFSEEQVKFCIEKRQQLLLVKACLTHGISLDNIFGVEVAYVLNVDNKDDVTLFTPCLLNKPIGEKQGLGSIENCIRRFNGIRSTGVKAGMLVLKTPDELITLDEKTIKLMSSKRQWGFISGIVCRKNEKYSDNMMIIKSEDLNMVFNIDGMGKNKKMAHNTKVRFFPTLCSEKSRVLEATYIMIDK